MKSNVRNLLDGRFYDAEVAKKFAVEHPREFREALELAQELYGS